MSAGIDEKPKREDEMINYEKLILKENKQIKLTRSCSSSSFKFSRLGCSSPVRVYLLIYSSYSRTYFLSSSISCFSLRTCCCFCLSASAIFSKICFASVILVAAMQPEWHFISQFSLQQAKIATMQELLWNFEIYLISSSTG